MSEYIATQLKNNTDLVINFANPENKAFDEITEYLKMGKMLVDWLKEWRSCNDEN